MRIPEQDNQQILDEHEHEDQTSLRMVWFAFAGWWLSAIWVLAAWLCILCVPFTAIGLRMLGNLTRVTALRSPGSECAVIVGDTLQRLKHGRQRQRPVLVRLLYTVTVGWWLSLIWLVIAWGQSLSIQCRPSGLVNFMRLPEVMTLRKY